MRKQQIFCCAERVNEISLRYNYPPNRILPVISGDEEAKDVMRQCFEDDRITLKEFFFAMYLNRANEVLAISCIGVGTEKYVPASIKEIVSNALLLNAGNVIIAHNHPSGNLSFSFEDKILTKRIREALELFDIRLLDHLLFTKTKAVALSEADEFFFET